MRAVCAWETWIYLYASYKKRMLHLRFLFSLFRIVREFSSCNKMFACTTTQVFSVESIFSALMSGDVKTIKAMYNFYKNNLDYKIKSGCLKTFNQLRNQVEENTITRETSSEIYVPQYFKTERCWLHLMFYVQFLPSKLTDFLSCLKLSEHLFPRR